MRPSRRERRDRRAKQPKEEERPVSGWQRPPDSTDKQQVIAAQKKLNMGFDCRAGYGRRRDQTDLRAIEAREQARYEALARRKEREARPKKPIQKRLRPLLRGCKPERVMIGKRPVNFPPKSKTVFPPLRSNWEDYGPAKMPTRYNEHVGESEVRIAPMSLMARQIMREELLRKRSTSPAKSSSSKGSPGKPRNRRSASPAKSSSSKGSPGKPKVGTGSIYDVLDRREPEGEVMEATLPDGRRVRVRVPPGALVVDARQSGVEVVDAPRTPSPRTPSPRRVRPVADDDLRVPGASPPPQPLLGRVVDGGPPMPLVAADDMRVPGASPPPQPLIADDDLRAPGDTPKPQPLLTWDATDGPPLPSVADDDLRVPGDTPKPRPLIADDDLRIPGASGPPRPLMADDGRRPRGDSMQDRPLTFNSSDDDRRMRGDSPPPQPLMAHQGPRRPQTPGAPLAQRAASPSPEDFVTIWDAAAPATPRQAAFDDERPRRRRAPDPPPEPPLVWKNDRPKRSKTARRRARRLEGLPDVIRRQANKF